MIALEDICIWKSMADDEQSSTFEIVRKEAAEGKEHPLGVCLKCSGYDYRCSNYVMRHFYFHRNKR